MTDDIKKDILWRVYLVYLGIFLLALAIVGKAAYIQFAEGPELIQKSEKQEIRVFDLEANRGNIYDAGGNLLATSVPIFEIRMDAANTNIHDAYFNENIDALAQSLSDLFGNKSDTARQVFHRRRRIVRRRQPQIMLQSDFTLCIVGFLAHVHHSRDATRHHALPAAPAILSPHVKLGRDLARAAKIGPGHAARQVIGRPESGHAQALLSEPAMQNSEGFAD